MFSHSTSIIPRGSFEVACEKIWGSFGVGDHFGSCTDFCLSARGAGNERECKQTLKKTCVMMSLLMSSPPISISHVHFRFRYSNFRDVVASFPPFSRLAARTPRRACSQVSGVSLRYHNCDSCQNVAF